MNRKILKFVTYLEHPLEAGEIFNPGGKQVLNRTEWRGMPPRTCGITDWKVLPFSPETPGPRKAEVEVTYKPKGCITFFSGSRYDGWSLAPLDQHRDGTLLDGKGQPLEPGQRGSLVSIFLLKYIPIANLLTSTLVSL